MDITHETHGHRGAFFIEQDGERVAELTLTRVNEHHWIIDHTEVASSLKGQGVGRKLLDQLVAWGRQTGTRFTAVCPFAAAQFQKDESIRDVLAR